MKIIRTEDIIKVLDNIKTEKDADKFFKKYRKLQYIDIMAMNYAEELVKNHLGCL